MRTKFSSRSSAAHSSKTLSNPPRLLALDFAGFCSQCRAFDEKLVGTSIASSFFAIQIGPPRRTRQKRCLILQGFSRWILLDFARNAVLLMRSSSEPVLLVRFSQFRSDLRGALVKNVV